MAVTDSITNAPLWVWVVLASGALCSWAASRRYYKGLNKYNGPFLASLTNFWRLWQWLWYTDMCYFPRVVKYGKIIRVGPDTLLFNDPEAIKDIYMTHFNKVSKSMESMAQARRALLRLTQNLFRSSDDIVRLLQSSPRRLPRCSRAQHFLHHGPNLPQQATKICCQRVRAQHTGELRTIRD